MKAFIVSHAWTRVKNIPDDFPLADLDVVYNLGHGDPAHPQGECIINFDKRDSGNATACSTANPASQTSTQSPSTFGTESNTSAAQNTPTATTSSPIASTTSPRLVIPLVSFRS